MDIIKQEEFIADKSIRLDTFLSEKLENTSRSKIKNWIDENLIEVNNKIVNKAGYKLNVSDKILVKIPRILELSAKPQNIKLDIIYEDDDLMVINKPQGMVVHPACGNYDSTLVNALMYHTKNLSNVNGEFRPGIVHRLDKDTSGLLLIAKNDFAHENLSKQIQQKTCKRFYKAILIGTLKNSEGIIETNLIRSLKDRKKYEVCLENKGKNAITLYKTLESFKGYSLVEFELKTGRTHQIRVHSKHLGHPILGDRVYGINQTNVKINGENFKLLGQLLHAYKIIFTHPKTQKIMEFNINLPENFNKILNALRKY